MVVLSPLLVCDVDYNYAVSYRYDINGNILNKSDVGDYSYNNVNSTHPHTPIDR
jgi:hypothetical protein